MENDICEYCGGSYNNKGKYKVDGKIVCINCYVCYKRNGSLVRARVFIKDPEARKKRKKEMADKRYAKRRLVIKEYSKYLSGLSAEELFEELGIERGCEHGN